MKIFHRISTKQHGGMKSGVSRSKNSTISQAECAGELSCWKVQKLSYPYKCVKVIVLGFFVATMVKLQQFVISEPEEVHHRNKVAIQQLSAPVATSQFVLAAHYDVSITSRLAQNI